MFSKSSFEQDYRKAWKILVYGGLLKIPVMELILERIACYSSLQFILIKMTKHPFEMRN